jgi:hypothetical protein
MAEHEPEITDAEARAIADQAMGIFRSRPLDEVFAEHANDEPGPLKREGGQGWPEPEAEAEPDELRGGASNEGDERGGIPYGYACEGGIY